MRARRAFPVFAAVFSLIVAAFLAPPVRGADPAEAALTVAAEMPSRLVLAHWPAGGWLVRQSGRQAALELPGARLVIPTEAIALPAAGGGVSTLQSEITDKGTTLRIGLGCDCTLAVRGDGRRLLIDIVGATRTASPTRHDGGPAPRLARTPPARPGEGEAGRASAARDSALASEVDETRSRLLHQLRRAAEAGLVSLRPGRDGLLAELRDRASIAEGADPAADDAPERLASPDGPGGSVARAAERETPVRASFGGPRPLTGGATTQAARPAGPPPAPKASAVETREALISREPASACIPSERFVLPDPMPPQAFVDEAARLRRSLLGEFDRPDPSVALELARLYLGHGLGAEAHMVLAEFASGEPGAPLLSAISRLAEGRPLPAPNLLDVPGCDGQHALWQALDAAIGGRPARALELLQAASGALEQVTHGLRGRVAARLGLAAAAQGDWIAAHRLEAMAKRALARHDRAGRDMLALLSALVLRARGNLAEAERQLAGLADARSPIGAEALLLLAEWPASDEGEGALPLASLRTDLGALATGYRGTPLGVRAFRAEVVTTGRVMGRDAAFDLLDYGRAAGLVDEGEYRNILAEIGAGLEGRAGDTPLAILYENEPERFTRLLSDDRFRAALARSYISLGAPALAERVLRPDDLAGGGLREALSAAYLEIGDRSAARRLIPGQNADLAQAVGEDSARRAIREVGEVGARSAGEADAAERARAAWANGKWHKAAETLRAAASAARPTASSGSASGGGESMPRSDPDASQLALRLALAAKHAGRESPPVEALRLAAPRPALEAGLRALFGGSAEPGRPPSPEALAGILKEASDEMRMYREVIEDG